jgi:hypothetical protein
MPADMQVGSDTLGLRDEHPLNFTYNAALAAKSVSLVVPTVEANNLGGSYAGPAGPHGSNVNHIRERGYIIESPSGTHGNTPNIPYSSSSYDLCFKCHSEQSLRNDESFKQHWAHIQRASCATWHDSHGVPNGTAANNGSLMNFDLTLVAPNSAGQGPVWTGLTPGRGSTAFQGSCSLRCHSHDHTNASH